jgi:Ca2+/Na+ antiporter
MRWIAVRCSDAICANSSWVSARCSCRSTLTGWFLRAASASSPCSRWCFIFTF